MPLRTPTTEKITVSLAKDLVHFADQRATALGISRSQVIGQAVAGLRAQEKESLAREGYLFYAIEAEEFARVSQRAVFEAIECVNG